MTGVSSSSGRLPYWPSLLYRTPARRTCRAVTRVGQISVGLASGLIICVRARLDGLLGDPRARHRDRGSGLTRAVKQSQTVIAGRVGLEAASPARQDDAETTGTIVNGGKGLF